MSSIFGSFSPKKKDDECGEILGVTCEKVTLALPSISDFEIVYPKLNEKVLPLAGGAIVKIGLGNINIEAKSDVISFAKSYLDKIKAESFSNIDDLDSLSKFRMLSNDLIFNIGQKNGVRSSYGAPKIFISTSTEEISSPTSIDSKICEFKFIPKELLYKISSIAKDKRNLVNIIGTSGKKISEISEDDIFELVMELFPIFNISDSDITDDNDTPVLGGYYTIDKDNNAYVKISNLSGQNSAGFGEDIFSGRNLHFEIVKDNKSSILKIPKYQEPANLFLLDAPTEFPIEDDLELTFESNIPITSLNEIYLSIIADNISVPAIKGLKEFSNGIEVFTLPNLTKPVVQGTSATIESRSVYYNQTKLKKYFKGFELSSYDINELGIPLIEVNIEKLLGEKNRPEIVLSNRKKLKPNPKNNKQYFNPKIASARRLLMSNRPRLYTDEQIPKLWIRSDKISSGPNNTIIAKFKAKEFNKINIVELGAASFAVYVKDNYNQIFRVPGPNLTLDYATPALIRATPDGGEGSKRILITQRNQSIIFSGENLDTVRAIIFESSSGTKTKLTTIENTDYRLVISKESIAIEFITSIQNTGISSGLNKVTLEGYGSKKSNVIIIYISETEDVVPPAIIRDQLVFTTDNEFFVDNFPGKEAHSIPILQINHAEITIKSKTRLFTGNDELYAYIALKNTPTNQEILRKLELSENIKSFSQVSIAGAKESVLIPTSIEYTFTKYPSDFYRVSNAKAKIKIPGAKFNSLNFRTLLDTYEAYIVITSQQLSLLPQGQDYTFTEQVYSAIKLGNDENKPFSNGIQVRGLVASISGTVTSTFRFDESDTDLKEIFGVSNPTISNISGFEKISKLAVIFDGYDEPNLRRRYSFKLGLDKIDDKLVVGPKIRDNGRGIIAVFKNISTEQEGSLELVISKTDKIFNTSYDSTSVYSDFSIAVDSTYYKINSDEKLELIKRVESTSSSESRPGFISQKSSIDLYDLIIPNIGLLLNRASTRENIIGILNKIGIMSTIDLEIEYGTDGKAEIKDTLSSGTLEDNITSFVQNKFSVPSGIIIPSGSIRIGTNGALIYGRVRYTTPITIDFNIPQIYGIAKGNSNNIAIISGGNTAIDFKAGDDIKLLIRNAKQDLIIKFNEVSTRPRRLKKLGKGNYEAIVRVPETLGAIIPVDDTCIVLCASNSNSEYNKIARIYGDDFALNIDDKMEALLKGSDKIPDIEELKELLRDFPLRFAGVELDTASVPQDLINSFCDLSFHLTADLKIALNGFEVLMTPIQIIFCIIDVICSLLNPTKLARAIVRLFECLYDLLLLLPQISVPVMLLSLLLHVLKLLECVFEKVEKTIVSINNIIIAIERAIKFKNWEALKALEEALSESLFEIEAQISVLDPITSILAIFLELLSLAFRFPCRITQEDNDPACGIDGTLLAGIVAGIIAPTDEILPNALIPVAQPYTTETIDEAAAASGSQGSAPLTEPTEEDVVAFRSTDNAEYLESMEVDSNTLRSTNTSLDFFATFAPTFTKSRKGFGNPAIVKFLFRSRGENGFFNRKKIIDPEQTLDHPLFLMETEDNELIIRSSGSKGNFISPIDGQTFIDIAGDRGTVKPLQLTFEIPTYEVNQETGEIVQTGVETFFRTFDDIPKMAIVDEEFNLYFIEKDGIEFDSDGNVNAIKAKMVNNSSANKLRFSKEEQEIDTDGDGENDDEAPVFDFPQIYFVDMRQCHEQIQSICYTASINSFVLEDDTDDISDLVRDVDDCIKSYIQNLKQTLKDVRTSLSAGKIPKVIDRKKFKDSGTTLSNCIEDSIDDVCRFVVNPLNTSFKLIEDEDVTPIESFPDTELTSDVLEGFETNTPALTGAREYAAGIGDSVEVAVNSSAEVHIIPRDSFDKEIKADFTNRIQIDIVSDTTGSAVILKDSDNKIVTKEGTVYIAKITSTNIGEVKIRARICDRTIQAVTYSGIEEQVQGTDVDSTDCIEDAIPDENATQSSSPSLGALTKIDRILTIFFVNKAIEADDANEASDSAQTVPQAFGTTLEN